MRRRVIPGPRWRELAAGSDWVAEETSFHATLLECAEKRAHEPLPLHEIELPIAAAAIPPQPAAPGIVARTWSWLRFKHAASATRSLQVAAEATLPEELSSHSHASRPAKPGSGLLGHVWSRIRAKYVLSATKRLRVSELVSLGEKRFVAVVCVEGREFLVGGGASGVSLLTQLETGQQQTGAMHPASSVAEKSE
jgi:hypothetical protein